MSDEIIRKAFTIRGQVQGVGFRPFVWRLAREHGLAGFVRNTSQGVRMELQGEEAEINALMKDFRIKAPPRAVITGLEEEILKPLSEAGNFEILPSQGCAGKNALIPADIAPCPDCLAEMRDPADSRFRHPFISCTNCGPRFSIIASLPYDRATTTMGCFSLCPVCAEEYADPANRRFHAQPVACPQCGPTLWFARGPQEAASRAVSGEAALARAAKTLETGGILALKGLGGYQLACHANMPAVAALRERKARPDKAFAVMVKNLDAAREIALLEAAHEELLQSQERPIVFAPKRPGAPLSPQLSPDSPFVGLMLPATPLHELLFDGLGRAFPLVMTSGNVSGEPICLGNREAAAALEGIADGFLMHDRDVLIRVDDSVAALPRGAKKAKDAVFIRRARGYAPCPVRLGEPGAAVFGAGAELKSAFCITRGDEAFLSQHIGDMKNAAVEEFYRETFGHFLRLLEVQPEIVVHDAHPDFSSTRFAREFAASRGLPLYSLQHHAAHAASLCAVNRLLEPALVFCLDGTGLGSDGSVWGGELILMDGASAAWSRAGSFTRFDLPGGDAAAREPWRIARAFERRLGLAAPPERSAEAALDEMLEKGVNLVPASSCGRLFDALAALLALCRETTYEGQAALRLEAAAVRWLQDHPLPAPWGIEPLERDGLLLADSCALFSLAHEARKGGLAPGEIAARFHASLALLLARLMREAASRHEISAVGFSGGVMQNMLLSRLLDERLGALGLRRLGMGGVPPGDGGVALGQAWFGRRLRAQGLL